MFYHIYFLYLILHLQQVIIDSYCNKTYLVSNMRLFHSKFDYKDKFDCHYLLTQSHHHNW